MTVAGNLIKEGVSQIGLLGGEPLLYPSIIDLLRLFCYGGIPVTISTNGLSLPTGFDAILADSCGWGVMVSVDGPDADSHEWIRGKGTFDRTTANVAHLVNLARSCDFSVGMAATLNSRTVNKMRELYELGCQLGVRIIQFGVVKPLGNARLNHLELLTKPAQLISAVLRFVSEISCCYGPASPSVTFDFIDPHTAALLHRKSVPWRLPISTICVAAASTGYVDCCGRLWPCPGVSEACDAGVLSRGGFRDNSLTSNGF